MSLIEEILDFSKLKAHRLDLRLEAFDLAELGAHVIEEIESLAKQKNLELRLELAEPSVLVVNDRLRLRQILINLLSNAIKFTEQGSVCLKIGLVANDQVAIVVNDTGIGIDPTDQGNIFKEFRQLNQTMTRRHNGTGLGLSITDALVQLMQGSIVVDSKVGVGSTFRINLPRRIVAG
jgi:signal transduction histidine kinase